LIDLKEIKNKIITKNNLYCLCIISIIFFLDRYTKLFILNNFTENSYYLNNYMNFDLVWNTGIGFGLLQVESSFVYNLISFLIGIVILILIFVSLYSKKFEKVIFALIAGGAFGNFYDRITYKAVPDFIDIHYGNFHWFTFNVADIFITFGIIIYLVKEALIKK
tara:strand:+ start:182 stop:673 length:492 start_codon:yes stop_codon:yes gene_type:complete